MNRIDLAFQNLAATDRKALVVFLTAGDPDYDTSLRLARAACEAGADVIELGVPFSDPTCDGPVIQQASERALKNGMSLSKTFRLAAELRQNRQTPIVLFSYYNPLFKFGLERVAQEAAMAGVDGLLVVDLPPEEAAPLAAALASQAARSGAAPIHLIRLVAPTTTPERLRMLATGAGGFLYLISRTGVTGTGALNYDAIARQAAMIKATCPYPVCVGFGVASAADARALAPLADGVIVGSALIRWIGESPAAPDLTQRVAEKIRDLRQGLDSARQPA